MGFTCEFQIFRVWRAGHSFACMYKEQNIHSIDLYLALAGFVGQRESFPQVRPGPPAIGAPEIHPAQLTITHLK